MKNTSKIYVTQAGYDQYKSALEEFRKQRRAHLKTRADYGVSTVENPQTTFFDAELARIEASINDLENTIDRLEIVKKEHSTDGRIALGDIVVCHFDGTDRIMRVQLSGEMADINEMNELSKVTLQSPIGAALLGRKVGETVSYRVGRVGHRDTHTVTLSIISKENSIEQENVETKQPGEEK